MVRRYEKTVNMGDDKNPIRVDLYNDSSVDSSATYAFKSLKALSALNQIPDIDVGKGIDCYSARLPQYDESNGKFRAVIVSPEQIIDDNINNYLLIIDERLNPYEQLASAFHEMSHLIGGFHKKEKRTHLDAIRSVVDIQRLYGDLGNPSIRKDLKEKKGVDYDVSEKSMEELQHTLRVLKETKGFFGIDNEDLGRIGVDTHFRGKGLENMVSVLLFFSGIYFALPFLNITGNVIGSSYIFSAGLSIFLFFLSLITFTYRKFLFKVVK